MVSEPHVTCGWDTPLFLFCFSLHSYDSSNYRQTNRELQCEGYLPMYFSMTGNNQMQTYTSNITLGPETQDTRISAPQSNGLALPLQHACTQNTRLWKCLYRGQSFTLPQALWLPSSHPQAKASSGSVWAGVHVGVGCPRSWWGLDWL